MLLPPHLKAGSGLNVGISHPSTAAGGFCLLFREGLGHSNRPQNDDFMDCLFFLFLIVRVGVIDPCGCLDPK